MSINDSIIGEDTIGLVTGAAAGIGREVVRRLVERGVRVICADRDANRLANLVDGAVTDVYALTMDLDDPESVEHGIATLPREWRSIDILVNNAGHAVGGQRLFDQGQLTDWEGIIETNVNGMLRITHAVLPAMIERDRGHVINVGSTASLIRYDSEAVYIASKHAVHGFSEGLREDLAATGIRVTEVLPEAVQSDFNMTRFRGDAAAAKNFAQKYPGPLMPDDVARVIIVVLEQPLTVTIDQIVVARTRFR